MKHTEHAKLPFKKAGIVIHGMMGTGPNAGKHSLIAPYTEGRFSTQDKSYVLPKGAIDPGEDMLGGALRETKEETGIDVVLLLCATREEVAALAKDKHFEPEALKQLRAGESVKNLVSAGYPGVTVLEFEPLFADHMYYGRASNPDRVAMFGVRVEGIEHLCGALKNQQNVNCGQHVVPVKYSIDDRMRDHPEIYPSFDDFLTWMREQAMPDRAWNRQVKHRPTLVPNDDSPIERPTFFEQVEERWAKKHNHSQPITTRDQWKSFCEDIPHSDYRQIKGHFEKIKAEVKKLGITKSDMGDVKLDTKDTPLFFYQEGADCITTEQYLASCFERMRANPDYAKAFAGDCALQLSKPREKRIIHSQLAGIAPFIEPETIEAATETFTRDLNRKTVVDYTAGSHTAPWLTWGAPPPHRQRGYSLTEPLLKMHEQLGGENRVAWSTKIEKEGGLSATRG